MAPLYKRVLVPTAVVESRSRLDLSAASLDRGAAGPATRYATLRSLDRGERAAIGLALSFHAERILIDDFDGRAEAVRRNLRVTGTLGVLVLAHQRGLLDFEAALARLCRTNFYLSAELVQLVRSRL